MTGEAVSWWLFCVIAGLFLTLVFLQHSDHVTSWGRPPTATRPPTRLLGAHRRDRQHRARVGGRRDRAGRRRARSRPDAEHERLRRQRARHARGRGQGPDGRPAPRPAPRRGHPAAVGHAPPSRARPTSALGAHPLQRRVLDARRPRHPDTQTADRRAAAAGRRRRRRAAQGVPRTTSASAPTSTPPGCRRRRRSPGSRRRRLALRPSTPATSSPRATTSRRPTSPTTSPASSSTYDADAMNNARLRGRLGAGRLHRHPAQPEQRDPPAGGQRHRRRTDPLPEGAGAAAVVPRGRRLPLRQGAGRSAGNGGADLLAFLDDRVGYCEQFAASMAIMARILGIPSRVAVGFLEPEQPPAAPGSSPRTTCTPGPSSTSPAPAGCASNPPRRPGPDRSPTTPRPSSPR